MSFHPGIYATGCFDHTDHPVVELLKKHDYLIDSEAAMAVKGGNTATYFTCLGQVPISETARNLCLALGVNAGNPTDRTADINLAVKIAHNVDIQEQLARCGEGELAGIISAFAKAGATIFIIP